MYIDPHLRAARLPARSAQPRFTARPLASSLMVHGAVAVALLLFAHRADMPIAPEMPPVPMVFLPPAPAPAPPAPPQEPESPAPPQAVVPPPPIEQPAPTPKPEVPPAPPPAVPKETRPVRPRVEQQRHAAPRSHSVPVRQEPQQTTPAEPSASAPPATAPAPPAAVETGPVIPPRPLTEAAGNRQPYYPERAKRDGEQGRVILHVDVSAEGRAAAVAVLRSSGFPDLDQSAAEAVRGWRFIPASRGGRAIPGMAEVPVSFTLAD